MSPALCLVSPEELDRVGAPCSYLHWIGPLLLILLLLRGIIIKNMSQ